MAVVEVVLVVVLAVVAVLVDLNLFHLYYCLKKQQLTAVVFLYRLGGIYGMLDMKCLARAKNVNNYLKIINLIKIKQFLSLNDVFLLVKYMRTW